MDRIRGPALAFALSVALTAPALACRDAQDGKPWRPPEASPGAVVQIIDVATGSKSFTIGTASPDRVHLCVQMAVSDTKDQIGTMAVFIWAKSNANYYGISIANGRLRVFHRLFDKEFELVPPIDIDRAKKDNELVPRTNSVATKTTGDRMLEIDVKANKDGADVEIDGQFMTNIVARPPVEAKTYGLLFYTAPGKSSSFRLGPVLTFGDRSQAL